MTIVKLKDVNTEPNPDVVEVLERALAHAKRGRLRSVVIVGEGIDNNIYFNKWVTDHVALVGLFKLAEQHVYYEFFAFPACNHLSDHDD